MRWRDQVSPLLRGRSAHHHRHRRLSVSKARLWFCTRAWAHAPALSTSEPFALAAFSESQPGRQAGIMRREDGQAIREAFIKSQGKVKAVFPGTPKLVFAPERVPGTPTFFSSQGPSESVRSPCPERAPA